jgi:hypothetical protein
VYGPVLLARAGYSISAVVKLGGAWSSSPGGHSQQGTPSGNRPARAEQARGRLNRRSGERRWRLKLEHRLNELGEEKILDEMRELTTLGEERVAYHPGGSHGA